MKSSLIGIVLFSMCSFSAHAVNECNTKFTKHDRYDDLNKTLQCLSSKIQKLEQQVAAQNSNIVIPTLEKEAAPNNVTSAHLPYSDDNFLVTFKSCKKKSKRISCVVKYKNISDTNIELIARRDETYLLDENGERWDYERNTAIAVNSYTTAVQNKEFTTKFSFVAQSDTSGAAFSLLIGNGVGTGEGFNIAFNDILLTK